jgi:hypothetical protein
MCNLFANSIALALISLMILAQGCNQEKVPLQNAPREGAPQMFADAQTAAENSLETFRKLVNNQNYKELGFESLDEVASASLGEPIHNFLVRLDQLREYQPDSDPNELLTDAKQVYYPVHVKDQVRSSIIVEQANDKWKSAGLGNAGLAKQIAQARKEAVAPSGGTSSPDVIVQVPALGVYFIGRRTIDNNLTLTPLATYPTYNLRAGAAQPAKEVFATLVPFAKTYNGLPM